MSEQVRQIIPPNLYQHHFSSITFKTGFSNCVHEALLNRKWKECDGSAAWDLQWCEKQRVNDVFQEGISNHQRVNHFRLYTQLCRKDMLMKNVRKFKRELAKQKKLAERQWDFLPSTFFLPSQYIMFVEQFKKKGGLWILKPTGRCQGSGIFLVKTLAQVAPYRTKAIANPQNNENQMMQNQIKKRKVQKKPQIQHQSDSEQQGQKQNQQQTKNQDQQTNQNQTFLIQKYIDQPLLFGKKKFDMRIYVLCTDYRNLTVWLYRNGFARFTHEPYNTDDTQNLGGHLTNVEIQKHCDNYDAIRGGKWLLKQFKHYLFSRYQTNQVDQCFWNIKDIIIKSLQAVQKNILPSKSSFQLYGYDFMLDGDLKPWLIEVNGGPSMTANTEMDCQLKCGLIDDVLSIIDLEGILSGQEMTVGGFDLIMKKDVPIEEHSKHMYRSSLGTKNERKKVMRKIANNFMKNRRLQQKLSQQINEQKQMRKKKREEAQQSKKQKLLPDFYYNRKQPSANQNARVEAKEQLQFLQRQQQMEQSPTYQFIPLKANK